MDSSGSWPVWANLGYPAALALASAIYLKWREHKFDDRKATTAEFAKEREALLAHYQKNIEFLAGQNRDNETYWRTRLENVEVSARNLLKMYHDMQNALINCERLHQEDAEKSEAHRQKINGLEKQNATLIGQNTELKREVAQLQSRIALLEKKTNDG